MVLAVNCPAQDPTVGVQVRSSALSASARHRAGLHAADAFDDVQNRAVQTTGFATRQHQRHRK